MSLSLNRLSTIQLCVVIVTVNARPDSIDIDSRPVSTVSINWIINTDNLVAIGPSKLVPDVHTYKRTHWHYSHSALSAIWLILRDTWIYKTIRMTLWHQRRLLRRVLGSSAVCAFLQIEKKPVCMLNILFASGDQSLEVSFMPLPTRLPACQPAIAAP